MPGPLSEKQQQSEGNRPRMASGGARYLRYILFAFFVRCIMAVSRRFIPMLTKNLGAGSYLLHFILLGAQNTFRPS